MSGNAAALRDAAEAIKQATSIVVCAGAGMGVPSGFPVYRGSKGLWEANPPYAKRELTFQDLASPGFFQSDPRLAWGFYAARVDLYRSTNPHSGYYDLLEVVEGKRSWVYTSNVDGHFQKAGWSGVVECHGSALLTQCMEGCGTEPWPTPDVWYDPETLLADENYPKCEACGATARPNVLMFWDSGWDPTPYADITWAFHEWVDETDLVNCVAVEIGAGTAIDTVRNLAGELQRKGATLIRINPDVSGDPCPDFSFGAGVAEVFRDMNPYLADRVVS